MRASLLLTVSTNGKDITIPKFGLPYQNAHWEAFLESPLDNPEWKVLFEFYQKHPDIHIAKLSELLGEKWVHSGDFTMQYSSHEYMDSIEKLYMHYNHGNSD